MCGIFGIISNKPQNEDYIENIIRRMSLSLLKRGPDNSGSWRDTSLKVFLGHTRLSIIDISDYSNQPIHSNNNRYVMSYNGEIYNFKDLKKKLENEKIYIKNPNSDTNVLLSCFERWGINKTISQINGMFSIALFDKEERKITLIRDRIGIKPLFYCYINNMFVVASELKAFSIFKSDLSLNNNAMNEYLNYGFISSQQTIYKECNRLLPATILELNIDNIHDINITKYWNLYNFINQDKINLNEIEIINETSKKVEQSVKNQMISDVPIGAFLSGGVDSTTIVALMQSESINPIQTFSIGFLDGDFNEAEHAKEISNYLSTNHTELYISAEDTLSVIPKLANIYSEPFADSSQIPTFLVSKMAKEKVTVSLSGDGGDELFGGYNRYTLIQSMWRYISLIPRPMRIAVSNIFLKLKPEYWDTFFKIIQPVIPKNIRQSNWGNKIQKSLQVIALREIEEIYLSLVSSGAEEKNLVKNLETRTESIFQEDSKFLCKLSGIEKMMTLDIINYLPDDILTKVDRSSMAVSLEARVPFLDHRVVEFASRIPVKTKIKKGKGKWPLREVLYKHVPSTLIERPKMGFSIPLSEWLRGPLKDWAEELIDEFRLKEEGYLCQNLVKRYWSEHQLGTHDRSQILWNILMFQSWLEENK